MLDIQVTINGDKVVIEGLNKLSAVLPNAIDRGLVRAAKGVHGGAFDFLSGAGAKVSNITAGGYPVPIRTGHLRRMLDWLKPGATKQGEVGTFTAGPHEVVIYDSAQYANVIHEGKGSSAKFGPRRYLTDALEKFNQGAKIKQILEEELQKEIEKQAGRGGRI